MYILNKYDVMISLSPFDENGKMRFFNIYRFLLLISLIFIVKPSNIGTFLTLAIFASMIISSYLYKSINEISMKYKDKEYSDILNFKKSRSSKMFKNVWISFNIFSIITLITSIISLMFTDFKDGLNITEYIYPTIMTIYTSFIYFMGHRKYKSLMS